MEKAMTRSELIELAQCLAEHEGVTHWAISSRIFGKGNFFANLMNGAAALDTTISRAERWFGENWPEDLSWPEDIMRPDRHVDREQVA
jgi:hypothetical protein